MAAPKNSRLARKPCFVICPIGTEESLQRQRSERLVRLILRPALGPLGYEVIPAHRICSSGQITVDVIERLVASPLVVADLTDGNGNVTYELAIRHMVQLPTIHV